MNQTRSEESEQTESVKINVDLNFDSCKATINGKPINYEKQIFLKNGLLIKNTDGIP